MPRNYKRTPGFRTYHDCTDETLQKCLSLVKANKISMKAASRKYSIPYGTIRNKINGWHSKQYGGQKQLSGSFENTLKTLKFMTPFYGWGSTTSRLQPLQGGSLLLPFISQKSLILMLSTLERWKAEWTLEQSSGFEHVAHGLGIQHLNH